MSKAQRAQAALETFDAKLNAARAEAAKAKTALDEFNAKSADAGGAVDMAAWQKARSAAMQKQGVVDALEARRGPLAADLDAAKEIDRLAAIDAAWRGTQDAANALEEKLGRFVAQSEALGKLGLEVAADYQALAAQCPAGKDLIAGQYQSNMGDRIEFANRLLDLLGLSAHVFHHDHAVSPGSRHSDAIPRLKRDLFGSIRRFGKRPPAATDQTKPAA